MVESTAIAPTTVKGRVRAQLWLDALASHRAGRIRAVEVRASEYIGAGATSAYTLMVLPAVLRGAPAAYPGDLDAPKSWNHVDDVATTLVAASRAHDWGRAWHVPATSSVSVRVLTQRLAEIAHLAPPTVTSLSVDDLRARGEDDAVVAEMVEMFYLSDRPHILDSTETELRLGVSATDLDAVLRDMVR